MANRKVG